MREKYDFEAEEIPEQEVQHETVSSTKIRKAISEGYIQRANAYLDHPYCMKSEVEFHEHPICGANFTEISPSGEDKLLPPPGAYAAHINMDNKQLKGKAVFIIKGKSYCIFPLEEEFKYTKGKINIQLFKRVDNKSIENVNCTVLKRYINEIEELIY